MVRRLKDDVLNDMPEKRRHFIKIDVETSSDGALSSLRGRMETKKFDSKNPVRFESSFHLILAFWRSKRCFLSFRGDWRIYFAAYLLQIINEYYLETGKAKIRPAAEYIFKLLEECGPDQKILVFAHHLEVPFTSFHFLLLISKVLDGLCSEADDRCIEWLRIDGKTSAREKENQVQVTNASLCLFFRPLSDLHRPGYSF